MTLGSDAPEDGHPLFHVKHAVELTVRTSMASARVVENRVEFTIFDDPVGYTIMFGMGGKSQGKKKKFFMTKTKLKYLEWKKHVQATLLEICTKYGVQIPQPTREKPVLVKTRAYFRNGIHPDPENVHKGIKDSIWWAPKGERTTGDKYTGGVYMWPLYDADNPRVEIEISWST